MANRSFIIAVVLLVGAAILFSGMGSSTGKYASNSRSDNTECANIYERCVGAALATRTECLGNTDKYTCQQRYTNTVETVCRELLFKCIR